MKERSLMRIKREESSRKYAKIVVYKIVVNWKLKFSVFIGYPWILISSWVILIWHPVKIEFVYRISRALPDITWLFSAKTILFWIWKLLKIQIVATNFKFSPRKLFKGRNYLRKYGIYRVSHMYLDDFRRPLGGHGVISQKFYLTSSY